MPTALVTGASRGIGSEIARQLAAKGHDLVLVARSRQDLEALASELSGAHGVRCEVITADLADPAAPQAVFDAVKGLGLEVDVLVNNAGFGSTGAFVELDLAWELAMVQVNCTALTALTGLFLPGMVARKRGRVLNIASTAGFQAGPFMAVYYATKAYVISFSEAVAMELDGSGVTVTAHCPGATASAFGEVSGNGKNKLFTQQTPASAADVAAHAIASMEAGKTLAVHGFMNWLGAFGTRLIQRSMAAGIARTLNQP